MTVMRVTTEAERAEAYRIRKTVFVDEQHVPIEEEIDEYEKEAIHFICYENEKVVAASRLRFIDHYGKLERICVLKDYRGKQYGKKLIEQMEKTIKNEGYQKALLHAQTYAKEFYEKLGYQVTSEEFMDAGIPHVAMSKKLRKE